MACARSARQKMKNFFLFLKTFYMLLSPVSIVLIVHLYQKIFNFKNFYKKSHTKKQPKSLIKDFPAELKKTAHKSKWGGGFFFYARGLHTRHMSRRKSIEVLYFFIFRILARARGEKSLIFRKNSQNLRFFA